MKWLKESAVTVEKAAKMPPDLMEGKFTIGILADEEKPVYDGDEALSSQPSRP